MQPNLVNIDQAGKAADFISSILNISKSDQQEILKLSMCTSELKKRSFFIFKGKRIFKYSVKIQKDLNERIEKINVSIFYEKSLKYKRRARHFFPTRKSLDEQKVSGTY